MLQINQNAPVFSVPDHHNEVIRLVDFAGKNNVLLYFYPKDDTSGCTLEANQFTALAQEFANLDTVVLGVSKDSCQSHLDFIEKYQLKVALLADVDGELCDAYRVWQEKEKNGVKKMGIVRSTFLIDKSGVLRYVEYGVTADGHAQTMLDVVKRIQ